MPKNSLIRCYEIVWESLSKEDTTNGLKTYLSKRAGVKNISIGFCDSVPDEGISQRKVLLTYQEDLDETFGFPENLDKVIFLDDNSMQLPYIVKELALENQAGIVVADPFLKDDYYDEGKLFPQRLAMLIENANKFGVQIVGITPAVNGLQEYNLSSSEMIEYSIIRYLKDHPSIKKFIIFTLRDMQKLSDNSFVENDITSEDIDKARKILSSKTRKRKRIDIK